MKKRWMLGALLLALHLPGLKAAPAVGELQLMAVRGVPGVVGIVDGVAGPDGARFNVPGLSFFQPTSVTLLAGRQGDDVRLELGKFGWDESFMGGSTGDAAYHIDRFRTQGDLLVTVSAASAGTPYRLIVWSGEEVQPTLPSVVVPSSPGAGGGWPYGKLTAAVLAGLLLVGGAFALGRRRSHA